MLDDEMKDQMPLFGALPSKPEKTESAPGEKITAPPDAVVAREVPAPTPDTRTTERPSPPPVRKKATAPRSARSERAAQSKPAVTPPPKVSGAVPDGDVRLTANIRQDLHLKLKIAAAHQRTTIGELIEGLVERYL
jgi:hypothetical protein